MLARADRACRSAGPRLLSAAFVLALTLASRLAGAQVPDELEGAATPEDAALDLSTPRRTLAELLRRADEGEWAAAALTLDLSEVRPELRADVGVRVAQHLETVLDATGTLPTGLPDEPTPAGERAIEIARVPGIDQGVVLRRVHTGGVPAWKFSAATVRAAELLADRLDRGPIGNRTPDWLREPRVLGLEPWQWIAIVVSLALALAGAVTVSRATSALVRRMAPRSERPIVARFFPRLRLPVRAALFLALLGLFAPLLRLSQGAIEVLGRVYVAAWLLTIGWAFWRGVDYVAERIEERAAARDDWRARGVRTRAVVIRRVLHATGTLVVVAVVLLQFEAVRQLGVSLLASAGFAGIVFGIAAQRTLGNLIAGLQLSFAQPLRVGDQVVVEDEFGTVEELNLSYVVVRLWDHRRLILPIQRLLELPFENWTRLGTDLIGTVTIPVDFTTPVPRVRREIERFVQGHPLFDGATLVVQLVDLDERSARLRVLVSASDAASLFDLRCAVREFAVGLLQELEGGRCLPRLRMDDGSARPARS
jgi:small-conductance mechanosensitive channel